MVKEKVKRKRKKENRVEIKILYGNIKNFWDGRIREKM